MENENVKVKKTSKGLIIGIAIAAVIIIVGVVLFVLKPWATEYVATVDNLKITKQEYMVFTKFNMNQYLSDNQITTEADKYDWNTKKNGETAMDLVKKSTLDNLQEIKIQLIKAKEAGIELTSDDLTAIDKVINDRITQDGSKEATETSIKESYGVTLAEYKEVYKDLYLVDKYNSAERSKINVSDDEVKKYYDDHKKDFDKVTVTHILISTVDANKAPVSAGKKAEAKKKADELLAKVKAGEDIKALAEKNSEDPGVKENKGEYTFAKGQMVDAFEKWAFDSRVKGDADVVESEFGYHVMQFQNRVETPFDEIKESLKTPMIASKYNEVATKNMTAWKKEARFSIKENESYLEKISKEIFKY